jgi:hypothetical protein
MNVFHRIVRWGLGLHGAIHLIEFILNLLEGAWVSAFFTLIAALLMLSGAMIDYQHHSDSKKRS